MNWWTSKTVRYLSALAYLASRTCTFAAVPLLSGEPRYVEISGEVNMFTFQEGKTNDPGSTTFATNHFVCIVGTNEWRIDNDFSRGAEVRWFFDGTNVYDSIHPTNPTPKEVTDAVTKKFKLATAPFEVAGRNVTINVMPSSDGHPLGNVGVNIPWLAFCSGPYLKGAGRLIPIPVATLRHVPNGFAYADTTETFRDEFGLPRTVKLFTLRSLYQNSFSNFNTHYSSGNRGAVSIPQSPYPDGILKFQYIVTESTNFQGWNFPLRFEYRQNEPGPNGDFVARYAGVGRATSFRASPEPQNIFAPSMQQTFVDWRISGNSNGVHSITYRSSNATLLATNDPLLQKKLAAKTANALSWAENPNHEFDGLYSL